MGVRRCPGRPAVFAGPPRRIPEHPRQQASATVFPVRRVIASRDESVVRSVCADRLHLDPAVHSIDRNRIPSSDEFSDDAFGRHPLTPVAQQIAALGVGCLHTVGPRAKYLRQSNRAIDVVFDDQDISEV
jgi:hypothetical protein